MNMGMRLDIFTMGVGLVVVSSCLWGLATAEKSSRSLRQRYLQTRLCRCVEDNEVYYASDDWRNELEWGFASSSSEQGSFTGGAPQFEAFVFDQTTNLVIVDGITVLPSNHTTCAARTNREQFMEALISIASGFKALFSFGNHETQDVITTNESREATTPVDYWADAIAPRKEFVVSPCPPDVPPLAAESLPPAQYEPSTKPSNSTTDDASAFGTTVIDNPSPSYSGATTYVPTSLPTSASFGEVAAVPTAATLTPLQTTTVVYTESPTYNIEVAFGEPLETSLTSSSSRPTLVPSSSPTNSTGQCPVDAIALDTGNGHDRFVSSLIVGREKEKFQPQQPFSATSSPWTCQEPWGGSAQPLPNRAIWFSLKGNGGWLEVSTCSDVETNVQQRMHLIAGDCLDWMCLAAGQQNCLRGSSLSWLSEDKKQYWVLIHGDGASLDQDIGLNLRSPGTDRSELNSVLGESASPVPVPERIVSPFHDAESSQSPTAPVPAPRPGFQNLIHSLPPPTSIANVFFRSSETSPRGSSKTQSIYSSFVGDPSEESP